MSCIPFFLSMSCSFTNVSISFCFSFSTSAFYVSSIRIASLCWSGFSPDCRLLIDLSTSAILFLNLRSIFLCYTILFSVCCSINSSTACSFFYWRFSSSIRQSLNIFLISGSRFCRFCSSFLFMRDVFFWLVPAFEKILQSLAWLLNFTVRS